jgi:glycosyltransferase involved in cell wall biosynthesis
MKHSLIIIPFHLPWVWPADFMRQTATILSRDNTVLCLLMDEPVFFRAILAEGVCGTIMQKRAKGLWTMRFVHIVPFGQLPVVHEINTYLNLLYIKIFAWMLSHRKRVAKRIFWTFSPKFAPYIHMFSGSYTTLYDCVDYVWDPVPATNAFLRKQEQKLISSVDYVFVNSKTLSLQHAKTKNVHVVPLGFRLYQYKENNKRRPNLHFSVGKPLIGFVGVIDYRLDYPLLEELARKNIQWNIVLYGPEEMSVHTNVCSVQKAIDRLKKYPNVFVLQTVRAEALPFVIAAFDVCMIPYNTSYAINRYCYPMKIFEYFYLGKPVVSTPIAELRRFPNYVSIGKTAHDWEKNIQRFLSRPWPKIYQREQRKVAEANSWESKIHTICTHINELG